MKTIYLLQAKHMQIGAQSYSAANQNRSLTTPAPRGRKRGMEDQDKHMQSDVQSLSAVTQKLPSTPPPTSSRSLCVVS
ncbi:hypothetical protein DdX_08717 [Ditylenchus destructor]|uniref:Uncharacterized protein n=1 Tax=Ditylenchus destructor TaxID=166010 RepID=A0AAD4N4T4_9BILA|nr:hypothetical protein DdX_08717 [Ditylenchus destructor]